MDYKRTALIAGLAIISYFLLLAWNEDYPNQKSQLSMDNETLPAEIASSQALSSNNINALEVGDVNQDIPQINSTNTIPSSPVAENLSLITITTPVQIISINLSGGDIVGLTLPKYPVSIDSPDVPFQLLSNSPSLVYIAQSGLVGKNGPDATNRPLYVAKEQSYILNETQDELVVDLNFVDSNNVKITKRFVFSNHDYLITIQYIIDNQSQESFSANLFGQIKRDASDDPSSTGGMGMKAYLGGVSTTANDPYKKIDFGDIDDGVLPENVLGGWIGFSQHYFLSSWIPDSTKDNSFSTRKNALGEYIFGFTSPESIIPANSIGTIETSLWAGPKDQYRLEEISPNLGKTIDYGKLWVIASPIFWLLTQLNNLIGNFGFSIIALTLVIKILFSPLSSASYRSMAKMRRLQPKIQQLKDRYGDDKQKFGQEQMALWKKEKVNPLGGCLPMLLQMPVLIGIYWVLNESIELRQAHFILWYRDLSIMDPYLILPIIMGASMFVSQTLSPMTTGDPMQAKVMKFMPVIFTVFFLWFPAGLVLYWLVSNVFNICQQYYINKKVNSGFENKVS